MSPAWNVSFCMMYMPPLCRQYANQMRMQADNQMGSMSMENDIIDDDDDEDDDDDDTLSEQNRVSCL